MTLAMSDGAKTLCRAQLAITVVVLIVIMCLPKPY